MIENSNLRRRHPRLPGRFDAVNFEKRQADDSTTSLGRQRLYFKKPDSFSRESCWISMGAPPEDARVSKSPNPHIVGARTRCNLGVCVLSARGQAGAPPGAKQNQRARGAPAQKTGTSGHKSAVVVVLVEL